MGVSTFCRRVLRRHCSRRVLGRHSAWVRIHAGLTLTHYESILWRHGTRRIHRRTLRISSRGVGGRRPLEIWVLLTVHLLPVHLLVVHLLLVMLLMVLFSHLFDYLNLDFFNADFFFIASFSSRVTDTRKNA